MPAFKRTLKWHFFITELCRIVTRLHMTVGLVEVAVAVVVVVAVAVVVTFFNNNSVNCKAAFGS